MRTVREWACEEVHRSLQERERKGVITGLRRLFMATVGMANPKEERTKNEIVMLRRTEIK